MGVLKTRKMSEDFAYIQHPLLESKVATASALFHQWIKWCEQNNIGSLQMSHITDAYRVRATDLRGEGGKEQ